MPTPKQADLGEIHNDVSKFLRSLNLKLYFHHDTNNQSQNTQINPVAKALLKFKPKLNWIPQIQIQL